MSIETEITAIEAKIKKLKDACFTAGKSAEGTAEKILVDTVHELATVVDRLLGIHKATVQAATDAATTAAKTAATEAVKAAAPKASSGKQILTEESPKKSS